MWLLLVLLAWQSIHVGGRIWDFGGRRDESAPTDGGCCAWNNHGNCVDFRMANLLAAKNVFYELKRNPATGQFDICGPRLSDEVPPGNLERVKAQEWWKDTYVR